MWTGYLAANRVTSEGRNDVAPLLSWPETLPVEASARTGSTELELFVEAAVHGDPARFGDLLGTVTAIVLDSVVDVIGDEQRAAEVARAALIEVWRSAPLLDGATINADAWVRHIVRAQAVEWKRAAA